MAGSRSRAIGVGEMDVLQEVAVSAERSLYRLFLQVHVKGIALDSAVVQPHLSPQRRGLVQAIQKIGLVAIPALQREADSEMGGVLAALTNAVHRPPALLCLGRQTLGLPVRRRVQDHR